MAATNNSDSDLKITFVDFSHGTPNTHYYTIIKLLFKTLKRSSREDFHQQSNSVAANIGNLVVAVNATNPLEVFGFCVVAVEWSANARTEYMCVQLIESFVKGRKVATRMLNYLFDRKVKRATLLPPSVGTEEGRRRVLLVVNPLDAALPFWNNYINTNKKRAGYRRWLVDTGVGRCEGPLLDVRSVVTEKIFFELLMKMRTVLNLEHVAPIDDTSEGVGIEFTAATWNHYVRLRFTNYKSWPTEIYNWSNDWPHSSTKVLFGPGEIKTEIACPPDCRLDASYLPMLCSVFQEFAIVMHFIF